MMRWVSFMVVLAAAITTGVVFTSRLFSGTAKFLEGLHLADTPCLVTEWEGRKLRVPLVTYPRGKLVRIGFFPIGEEESKKEMFCMEIVTKKDRETVFQFYANCYKNLAITNKLIYRVYRKKFLDAIKLMHSREELVSSGSVIITLLPEGTGCLISIGSLLEQGKK